MTGKPTQRPAATAGTSALAHFARELLWWRERRGMGQERLAALALVSRQSVSMIEIGRRWPSREFAAAADRVLDTGGVLERLWSLVNAEQQSAKAVTAGACLADIQALVWQLALMVGVDPRLIAAQFDVDPD